MCFSIEELSFGVRISSQPGESVNVRVVERAHTFIKEEEKDIEDQDLQYFCEIPTTLNNPALGSPRPSRLSAKSR